MKINYKRCDKCGRTDEGDKLKIMRSGLITHYPFYDYVGFDLCGACLEGLKNEMDYYLNNKEDLEDLGAEDGNK